MILHTFSDGGARGNPGPAAIGVVVCDEHGKVLREAAETIGETTNNVAEYRAMLLALELSRSLKARRLICTADSQLIIFQLQGVYRIKDLRLRALSEKVKLIAAEFESVQYRQVPREHPMITRADKLLNQALNRAKSYPATPAPQEPPQGEFFR